MGKWLIGLVMLCLAGCADAPPPRFMVDDNVKRIAIGHSTESDVRSILGAPQRVSTEQTSDGTATVWIYQYIRQGTYELIPALRESLSEPAIHSLLTIHFDTRHIVKKVDRMNQEIRSPEEGGVLVPF